MNRWNSRLMQHKIAFPDALTQLLASPFAQPAVSHIVLNHFRVVEGVAGEVKRFGVHSRREPQARNCVESVVEGKFAVGYD